MQFFAEAIENADSVDLKPKRGPKNLLELLPEEFTVQDAIKIRRDQGLDAKGVHNMIYVWKNRGYILHLTDNSYKKVRN
jgi:hypothetical protein